MNDLDRAEAAFKDYIRKYIEDRDINAIFDYFTDDISFDGTGQNEQAWGIDNVIALIHTEFLADSYHYKVNFESVQKKALSSDMFYLVCNFYVPRILADGMEVTMYSVMSIIMKLIDGKFKICSVHSQTPIKEQSKDEFYPVQFSEKLRREQIELKEATKKDPMTDLLNKVAAEKMIQDILSLQKTDALHAIMIIDIDHFKEVNDSFGHLFGDHVIIKTADTISSNFRRQDIVARIGGDEFLIFMQSAGSVDAIKEKVSSLRDALNNSLHGTTCSFGIAITHGGDKSYRELFRMADTALYSAKSSGRNTYQFYDGRPLTSE